MLFYFIVFLCQQFSLRQKWNLKWQDCILRSNNQKCDIKKYFRICENHFNEIDIKRDGARAILRKNSVPTIFPKEMRCVFHSENALSQLVLSRNNEYPCNSQNELNECNDVLNECVDESNNCMDVEYLDSEVNEFYEERWLVENSEPLQSVNLDNLNDVDPQKLWMT